MNNRRCNINVHNIVYLLLTYDPVSANPPPLPTQTLTAVLLQICYVRIYLITAASRHHI